MMSTRLKQPVRAWHNDPQLKAETIRRMQEHREADALIQGAYYRNHSPEGFRGCAIGCLVGSWEVWSKHGSWHDAVEEIFGINFVIAYVIDDVFEALPSDKCADFAVEVLEAIPVGADLTSLASRFPLDEYEVEVEDPIEFAGYFIDELKNAPVPL